MAKKKAKRERAIEPQRDPLEVVVEMVIAGATEHEIRTFLTKEYPDRRSTPMIAAALAKLEECGEPKPEVVLGFAIEGTRYVYRAAVATGDYATALRALKQLVDLAAAS